MDFYKVEKAGGKNAKDCAKLIHLAYKDFSYKLIGTKDDAEVLETYEKLWITNNTRFSYEKSYVVESERNTIALLTFCDGKDTAKLSSNTVKNIFRINPVKYFWYLITHLPYLISSIFTIESNKDELCLLVLGVDSKYQGKGIGNLLLDFLKQKAIELKFNKISVLCSANDENVIRFYEKNCFYKVKILNAPPFNYYKMVREI